MPIYLRQSTASQEVPLGHFVDDADGKTAETGLTIANTDIKVWKAGATTLADKNSGGATHISGGVYYAVLDATDTDTIGSLVLFVAIAGALAVRLECVVLDEAVYDVWFGVTAPSTYAGGAVASVTGAVGSVTAGVTVDTNNDKTGYSLTQSFPSNFASLGINSSGHVSRVTLTDEATDLTNLPVMPADWLTAAGLSAGAVAEIQSGLSTLTAAAVNAECDTALADAGLTTTVTGRIDAAVSTRLASASYAAPLDAAGTRAAVGLASADLDTQLGGIATADENADAILARNVAGGSSTGRTVGQALAALRNKVAIAAGTLTVYSTDDTTPLWTAEVTSDADADPITAVDPG